MIGHLYSTSQNACIIRFVGGPYDGQSGLYDHDRFHSIQFSDARKDQTHVYEPIRSEVYGFVKTVTWDNR